MRWLTLKTARTVPAQKTGHELAEELDAFQEYFQQAANDRHVTVVARLSALEEEHTLLSQLRNG